MHTTRTAGLLAAVAMLLTGCANSSEAEAEADTKPKPTASKTKPATKNTPEPDKPLTLGKSWKWQAEDENGTFSGDTTVLAYKQPITGVSPPGVDGDTGEVWGQAEAKVCIDNGTVSVSQFPWSLAFSDGARVEVTGLSGGDFPRPEFPMDAVVKAGDCVRGLMMFPVPEGQRPERIIYAPEGFDEVAVWAVPAK